MRWIAGYGKELAQYGGVAKLPAVVDSAKDSYSATR